MVGSGVATIESRQKECLKAVQSIYKHVDYVFVVQNGFSNPKPYYGLDKVVVVSTINSNIKDLGDANKFLMVDHFSVYLSFDDDLIYSDRTINSMFNALTTDFCVSHHGRVMIKNPVSYYKDKEFVHRCTLEEREDRYVDFPGTGVMLINNKNQWLQYSDFKTPNMADVYVGLQLRLNKLKAKALAHQEGDIIHQDIDLKDTIFDKKHKTPGHQDNVLREWTLV